MKYIITLIIFVFSTILSCNTSKENNNLFSRDDLPASQYTINTDKDTTIQTVNGALLKIPKGAIKSENGRQVTLEIKEAYSLSQMIQAGLVTESDGEPLSSGGMIYINGAAGQKLTITQGIKVAIPAEYLTKEMQLYKGDTTANKINWKDPQPLQENKQLTGIEKGQILFQQNCATCHAIDKALTGPALAHFPKRFRGLTWGGEGLSSWYHGLPDRINQERPVAKDTSKVKEDSVSKDVFYRSDYNKLELYVCNLIKMYGVRGTAFNFERRQLFDLYNYIQNESDKRSLPFPSHAYLDTCIDSCENYRQEINGLQNEKQIAGLKRKGLINDNGPLVDNKPDTTWTIKNSPYIQSGPSVFEDMVVPNYYDAVYYQFTIESFGWYNIDMMMKNVEGAEESELFARVVGEYREKTKIYLIIPSVKTYGEGGPTGRNADEYAFFYKTGKLSLPQNVSAYILAVTETEDSIAFGLKEFTTSRQQQIDISLHLSSKAEFTAAMQQFDPERLHIKVNDSKNANEIRKTDTDLKNIDQQLKDAEKLKPKRCDCDCRYEYPIAEADILNKVPATTNNTVPGLKKENQSAETLSIKVFPNPSTTSFTIEISSNKQKDGIKLKAMDISGKLVESRENVTPGQPIRIGENYRAGIYLVEIIQGGVQRTIRLIKQ